VYNVSVAEPFRRRGFGEAITWAAVAAGLQRGAIDAWLGSSAMGYALYRRMGFSQQYEYVVLAPG
jgi:ribosomal protein S18 acetylase RimI-like enzyme